MPGVTQGHDDLHVEHAPEGGTGRQGRRDAIGRIGQTLFDPRHGVVVVEARETRVRDGRRTEYLALRALADDMRILVPRASAGDIGIRRVMSAGDAAGVLAELGTPAERVPDWTAGSFAELQRQVVCPDPVLVAHVIRDLAGKAAGGRLRPTEQALYEKATGNLASELCEALSLDRSEALLRIDDALAVHRPPSGD